MSDYTPITIFTTKDNRSTGDPEKIISGADVDAEFSAIQTAIATKYDSGDVASSAQAIAGTSNSVLITPLQLENWASDASSVVAHLQNVGSLATNGDKLFFFDDTDDTTKALTVGTGLAITTTTLGLSHLGIESLTDPNDDRILFWDDSAGATAWLDLSSDFSISGTTISLASTISAQTITTLTSTTVNATTLELGSGATVTGAGTGQIDVDNQAVFSHASSSYASAQITFNTSAASGGSSGDIWFQYTA